MKSLELTLHVLEEYGKALKIDTRRDRETLKSRAVTEGEGFLTLTLPRLEKELLAWLDFSLDSSDLFSGFKRRGGLPAFLQGFLRVLSHRVDGVYVPFDRPPTRDEALSLKGLRQILSLHGKRSEVASDARVAKAVQGFRATEDGLRSFAGTDPDLVEEFYRLFGTALHEVEKHLFNEPFVAKHGSGAVAGKESVNSRWRFDSWPHNLQRVIPFWEVVPLGQLIDGEEPQIVSRPRSRLTAVPKTASTPRLISIEPWQHQFVQQGLLRLLKKEVSRTPAWREMGWTDQSRNAILARTGSQDRSLATLDLSEASDRVHKRLVWDLLSRHRYLRQWVFACRSTHVEMPDGLIELEKFSSMGSALTFPIESMVFYAIASLGRKRSGTSLKTLSVYGDDIIVPTESVTDVISLLEFHSFKVNRSKSFTRGWFKESCGSDWFGGYTVNFVRVRHTLDDTRSGAGLEKNINLRNRLFEAGLFGAVSYLDGRLGHVPFGPVGTPHLARFTYDQSKIVVRTNKSLQRLEFKALRIERMVPQDELAGWPALNKVLTLREVARDPLTKDHLTLAGRPSSGRAKTTWAAY